MNLTYFLGAGASANACPILKGLGEKMVELSTKYLEPELAALLDHESNSQSLEPQELILFEIGRFGKKALQFGTIDTYAKKLFLSNDYKNELNKLKRAVSLFFTIWESMINEKNIKDNFVKIDLRYISLLASILEKTQKYVPKINQNIKFITWNYDLQLERAYKAFCMDHDWNYVSDHLKFRINKSFKGTLDICHLNGYNGFYSTNRRSTHPNMEIDTIDRDFEDKNVYSILKELEFVADPQKNYDLSFENHINYAWESNALAVKARKTAMEIFAKTDTLIIIGYSFPPFNKEIDKELFKKLNGRKTKIYYQDPNASEEFISILTYGCDTEIHCINDRLDHFLLPYDF